MTRKERLDSRTHKVYTEVMEATTATHTTANGFTITAVQSRRNGKWYATADDADGHYVRLATASRACSTSPDAAIARAVRYLDQ